MTMTGWGCGPLGVCVSGMLGGALGVTPPTFPGGVGNETFHLWIPTPGLLGFGPCKHCFGALPR
jgi:hypothetical protein